MRLLLAWALPESRNALGVVMTRQQGDGTRDVDGDPSAATGHQVGEQPADPGQGPSDGARQEPSFWPAPPPDEGVHCGHGRESGALAEA